MESETTASNLNLNNSHLTTELLPHETLVLDIVHVVFANGSQWHVK